MKILRFVALFFLVAIFFSGCASKSALYEPEEDEIVGEAVAEGVAAVFEIFDEDGTRGFLTYYEPKNLGSLYPGKKVFLVGDSGEEYEATFRGLINVKIEGVFDVSLPIKK